MSSRTRGISVAPTSLLTPLGIPTRPLAVAAAVLLLVLCLAAWRIGHPTSRVPQLVGLQLSETSAVLEDAGIPPADVTVLTRVVEPKYVGTIVDQQPQPGLPSGGDGVQIAVGVAR